MGKGRAKAAPWKPTVPPLMVYPAALAGRDLDALIGEHVLGYSREGQPKDARGEHGGEPILIPPGGIRPSYFTYPNVGRLHLAYHVPRYSTDLEAAISLLWITRRRKDGEDEPVTLFVRPFQLARRVWFCGNESETLSGVFAETLPVAICVMALEVMGYPHGWEPSVAVAMPEPPSKGSVKSGGKHA